MYKIFALGVLAIALVVALFIDGFMPATTPSAENAAEQQPANTQLEQQPAGNDMAVAENYAAVSQEAEEFDDSFGEPTDTGLPMFDTKGAAEDEDFGDIVVSRDQEDPQPSQAIEGQALTAGPAPRIVRTLPEQDTAKPLARPAAKYVPKAELETAIKPTETIRY
ncbi:hypothetical protein [Sphingorhabdus sp. Alg239-R122]|uniref:hypothetical protein n=1 Tax=Sphingorhabdus sp. Alg239-R122 TaxID=2305989 RepID=UPI0013D9A57E|nr:hypothetical protein [Sphingorhabdus sp. Alg239-R122]